MELNAVWASKNYKDIKPGDKIEVYDRKEEAQSM